VKNEFLGGADFGAGVTLAAPAGSGFGQYLARYAPSGQLSWAEETSPFHTQTLTVGPSGSFWTRGFGDAGNTLRRWDASGSLLWERAFTPFEIVPDEGDHLVTAVGVGPEGLDVDTTHLTAAPATSTDAALIALDPAGAVRWTRTLGGLFWPDGPSQEHALVVVDAQRAPGGGALLLLKLSRGTAGTADTERGFAVMRVRGSGEVAWLRRFPEVKPEVFPRLRTGPDGQALLQFSLDLGQHVDFGCGPMTGPELVLTKLAPDGASEWTRRFPGFTELLEASFDPQGDILLAGVAISPCDLGGGEVVPPAKVDYLGRLVVAKLGADGGHRRSGVIGGYFSGIDRFQSLADAEGHLIVAGTQAGAGSGLGIEPQPDVHLYLAKIAF
jgi:hypothetical protein